MSLSLRQMPQNDEAWRQGRHWSRPVELPDEDRSLHLCARHRAMNLKSSDFYGWPKDKELPPDTDFGLLAEVLERSDYCVLCRLIADSASHTMHANDAQVLGCWIRDGVLEGDDTTSLRIRVVPDMIGPEDAFAPFDVVPLNNSNKLSKFFAGRRVNTGQINLDLVQSWIRHCNDWHGSECTGTLRGSGNGQSPNFDPFIRLLDLEEDKLVELQDPGPYVALSYVWGTKPVFRTLKDNIKELKSSGGLAQKRDTFPKSIRDAMTVTLLLGYRYVWIDSICIIQDSNEDKSKQLAAMDHVYTRAALTIVAAGGDGADAGLPGLVPGSRSLTQVVADYSSELKLVTLQPDCQLAVETTTWNTRGWTYQERILSQRYLFFVNDTVYFQCHKAVWGEDYLAEHQHLQQTAPMMDISLSRSWQPPTMTRRTRYRLDLETRSGLSEQDRLRSILFPAYCQLIAEYTSRNMSYPTDRLNGVGGILSVLDQDGKMDYMYGLPRPLLEAAILWRPQQDLTRVPIDPATGRALWPSWSWAGWIGGVEYDPESDYNGLDQLSSGSLRTRSITKLSHCRFESHGQPRSEEMVSLGQNIKSTISPHGLYIRTRAGKFRLTLHDRSGQVDEPPGIYRFGISYSASSPPRASLGNGGLDDDEPWLGTIRLPKSFRRKLSNEYEFIILSEAYNFSSEELGRQASRYTEPYSIFNVMLVKRMSQGRCQVVQEDDPATVKDAYEVERIGVGRMMKEAWSSVGELKDFILV
ncbi:hypothetical protein PFICI_02283 [Pestalotiopsis fici W106-1]|uniref:Heterokaryon incompatibility domain-containing protein n=1 Tax=Pestalotiopsis fici (strain W106-1 / CGMCC3.15140) TaxID=1229662 RepID=W3XDV5_PESFW|nr:uncharacterized protein PFICI_02283 [Pestalotiopsis fici W106-1]ETS84258.1 hypothetical protein PFICI_02283 [Pestalotiopsis fici W106-1]